MNECLETLNETNRSMHRNKVLCALDILEGIPCKNFKEAFETDNFGELPGQFLFHILFSSLSRKWFATFSIESYCLFHAHIQINWIHPKESTSMNEGIMKIFEKWGATVFNWKVSLFLLLRCYRKAKQHFLLCRLVKMRNCIKLSIFIVIAFVRADTARPGFVS